MKKKKFILAFLFIIILVGTGCDIYSKQQSPKYLPQKVENNCTNLNVDDIKKEAQQIEDNIKKYTSTTKDILGQSAEGGVQSNYKVSNVTVLIKQIFYGETGKSEVSYYLQNGKVFYFTKKNTEYLLPLSADSSGKVKNIEIKDFYLDVNQELCSWYSNQKIQPNNQDTWDLVNYLISGL